MTTAGISAISQLPWAAGYDRFSSAAAAVRGEGACCLFVIDASIPAGARSGYAALVIAYARATEPVTILEDGAAALLICDGGVSAGRVAARRLLDQMSRLGLQQTLRAGVSALRHGDVTSAIAAARALAVAASAGEVAAAG